MSPADSAQGMMERHCILVGMPGVGKTTIGRRLAARLGVGFVDLDAVIEADLGCSIRVFFEHRGEAAFRDVEAHCLKQALKQPPGVLSTGGGIVLRPDNRAAIHEHGTVVYLRSTPDRLVRRLRHDTKRPLLQVAHPLKRLEELHAQRDPLYREVAHYVMDIQRGSVATLVGRIVMQLDLMRA